MKRILYVLICLFSLSCSKSSSTKTPDPNLISADSVQLVFFTNSGLQNDPQNINTVITSSTTIQELSALTLGKKSPLYKCGYTGALVWYAKDSVLLDMSFNLAEECNHVVFMDGDNVLSKKISQPVRDLLLQYEKELPESSKK